MRLAAYAPAGADDCDWADSLLVAAGEAFSAVAADAIRLLGGIAITWEHKIQRYLKRVHGGAQLLGPTRQHRRRLDAGVF